MTTVTVSTTPGIIWYKAQRVIRTLVAVGIPAFLGFALVLPSILDAVKVSVSPSVYLVLVGFAAIVTVVAGALTRVMAIPTVNNFLTRLGLGSVPKSAVTQQIDPAVLDAALAIAAKPPTA